MKIRAENNRYYGDQGWEASLELFSDVVVNWRQWLGSSAEHIEAANVLLKTVLEQQAEVQELMNTGGSAHLSARVSSIYLFHCALSIENSLKGVVIGSDSIEIKSHVLDQTKLPGKVLTHDLNKLACMAGFDHNLDNEYIFKFLTFYGVWSGKYPTPIKSADSVLTTKLSNNKNYLVGGYNPETIPAYLEFAVEIYNWAREKLTKLSN